MNLTATAHFVCSAERRGWDEAAVSLTVTSLAFHSGPEAKWNSSSHTLRFQTLVPRRKNYLHRLPFIQYLK
uniref:Uncharacterized protein n=1 Tax=Setaria italica TaxID=4555 RepID=K3XP04_SETIT